MMFSRSTIHPCLVWLSACVAAVLPVNPVVAEPTAGQAASAPTSAPTEQEAKSKDAVQAVIEKASVTEHEITIDGSPVAYQATAANMLMKDEADKLKARVFFVAYERKRKDDIEPIDRPLTFVFNGGPGAASVWLHLGTAGPFRIRLYEDGTPPPPPFRLVDNAYSWIDVTDLVCIDPVGTGFSRPAEGEKGDQFYGVQEDINWVGDFIRLYISHYRRWISPLFLAGESYGTTRAAGLAEHLLDRHGIAVNGIALISSVLDFQTLQPADGNDLPYPLYLPTYTATAWHYKLLSPELMADFRKTLKEVEEWAINAYMPALSRGSSLTEAERKEVIERLTRYTSLPADLINRANLRILPSAFQKHLLASERTLVGRFDSRIRGFDPQPLGAWPAFDPSLSQYLAIYSATFNDYVRRTLKYDSVLPYEVLSDRVRPWNYGKSGHGYLSVIDDLRSAMVKNPSMKILFASGYFDLATPYFAADFTINRLNLSPALLANVTHTYYMGGHMMYHHAPSLRQLKADMATLIRSATQP